MKAKLTYQQGKEIKEKYFDGELLTVTTKVDSLISIYDRSSNLFNMHPDYFISFEYVEEIETSKTMVEPLPTKKWLSRSGIVHNERI
jgi:hypothetical protein